MSGKICSFFVRIGANVRDSHIFLWIEGPLRTPQRAKKIYNHTGMSLYPLRFVLQKRI